MSRDVVDLVERIEALFSDPEKFTQGAWARDEEGVEAESYSGAAVCWCVEGAAMYLDPTIKARGWSGVMNDVAEAILEERGIELPVADPNKTTKEISVPTVAVNDVLGYEAVLEMLARTKARFA